MTDLADSGILPIRQSSFPDSVQVDGDFVVDGKNSSKAHEIGSRYSSDFPLVGHGIALPSCGTYVTLGCLNVGKHVGTDLLGRDLTGKAVLKRVKISCFRPDCPVCSHDWAVREARRVQKRLEAFGFRGRKLKPIHVTVSVPSTDYSLNLDDLRLKARKSLKAVGFLGGILIYHPKRFDQFGLWYFSPHFHALGYGWISDTRKNYIESGFVVKNLGIRKTVGGTAWYQLSHAGFLGGRKHIAVWFGLLSYNKLKVQKEVKKYHVCPVCGDRLHRVFRIGGDLLPPSNGDFVFDSADNWQIVDSQSFRSY